MWAAGVCSGSAAERAVRDLFSHLIKRAWMPRRGLCGAVVPDTGAALINSSVPAPVAMAEGLKFSSISVGMLHICGIESGTARVICFG